MSIIRRSKPGISGIGKITDVGQQVVISGWVVSLCIRRCTCHSAPLSPHGLVLSQDNVRGELGLRKYRACYCCEPWTYTELRSFVHDLAEIQALIEPTEQPT